MCLEKPEDIGSKETLKEKIYALKQIGRHYTLEQLHILLSIINKRNIVDISLHNIAINNINSLYATIKSLEDLETDAVPIIFIEKFISLLELSLDDTPNINYIEKKEYSEMINYLLVTNAEMKSNILRFITINTKKQNKDVAECINKIYSFNLIETSRFIDGRDETTFKRLEFIKNSIRSLSEVFPNIIINKVNPCSSKCKIPKHWKLSEFHNKDMIIILNKFYINFIKLFDNKTIRRVMEESQRINKIINNLVILTIYFTDNGSEYKDGSTIFNTDICNMLYEYYFLSIFSNIINTIDTSVDLQIKTPSEQEEEKELEESLSGDNDLLAQHILMGQRENTQGKIAELLFTHCSFLNMFICR